MKLDTLLEYFPVPKYLELPTVGIDISDNFIRYVELTKVGGAIKLGKYGKKVLDEGKKEYVGDDTINNEHLKKELMEVKEKI